VNQFPFPPCPRASEERGMKGRDARQQGASDRADALRWGRSRPERLADLPTFLLLHFSRSSPSSFPSSMTIILILSPFHADFIPAPFPFRIVTFALLAAIVANPGMQNGLPRNRLKQLPLLRKIGAQDGATTPSAWSRKVRLAS